MNRAAKKGYRSSKDGLKEVKEAKERYMSPKTKERGNHIKSKPARADTYQTQRLLRSIRTVSSIVDSETVARIKGSLLVLALLVAV